MSDPTDLVHYWSQYYEAPTPQEKEELIKKVTGSINKASRRLTVQAMVGALSQDLVEEFSKKVLDQVKQQSEKKEGS
jgi:catalase